MMASPLVTSESRVADDAKTSIARSSPLEELAMCAGCHVNRSGIPPAPSPVSSERAEEWSRKIVRIADPFLNFPTDALRARLGLFSRAWARAPQLMTPSTNADLETKNSYGDPLRQGFVFPFSDVPFLSSSFPGRS